MFRLVICIGSNIEEQEKMVKEATVWLEGKLENFVSSSVYRSPGVGHPEKTYSNCVVTGLLKNDLERFKTSLKDYEFRMGRDEEARKKAIVPIDIDLVMIDDEIVKPWDIRQKFFVMGFSQIVNVLKP